MSLSESITLSLIMKVHELDLLLLSKISSSQDNTTQLPAAVFVNRITSLTVNLESCPPL